MLQTCTDPNIKDLDELLEKMRNIGPDFNDTELDQDTPVIAEVRDKPSITSNSAICVDTQSSTSTRKASSKKKSSKPPSNKVTPTNELAPLKSVPKSKEMN